MAPSASGDADSSRRLPRYGLLIPLLVALVAVLVRCSLAFRIEPSVLGGVLVSDSQSYWDWATKLLEGRAEPRPFFLAPLYPYVLAAARAAVGDRWLSVVCLQACFGALAAALISDTARRLSSPVAGLACGLVAALHAPLVLHDNLVLAESTLFLLGSGWVWLATTIREEGKQPLRYAALGCLTGLLALGRGTQIALLLVIPLLARSRRQKLLGTGIALCAAVAFLVFPLVQNHRACGEIIPTTYSGGYNLAVGFGPGANGDFNPPTGTSVFMRSPGSGSVGGGEWDGRAEIERRTGRAVSPQESSRYWADQAVAAIRADPVRAARLAGLKVLMLLNHREYPQIENLKTYERVVGPVGLPSALAIPFAVALALVAIRARFVESRTVRALTGVLGVQVLVLVPFFVTDRYRLHLLPALLVLAASGLQTLWRARHARRREESYAHVTPALIAGLALSLLPLPGISKGREEWGIEMDIGERALRRGDYAQAIQHLEQASAVERGLGASWGRSESMRVPLTAHAYALGRAYLEVGQPQAARPWLLRARGLSPSVPGLGTLIEQSAGEDVDASTPWDRALRLARAGKLAEAESLFAEIVRQESSDFRAWGGLVRVQCQSGRIVQARKSLEDGRRAGWKGVSLELHEGLVLALEGHHEQARRIMRGLDASAIGGDPVLADLWRVLERLTSR